MSARAQTSTMPDPMRPQPITPTTFTSSGFMGSSSREPADAGQPTGWVGAAAKRVRRSPDRAKGRPPDRPIDRAGGAPGMRQPQSGTIPQAGQGPARPLLPARSPDGAVWDIARLLVSES